MLFRAMCFLQFLITFSIHLNYISLVLLPTDYNDGHGSDDELEIEAIKMTSTDA